MIQAGKYGVQNDVTTEHFPVRGEGRHEVSVVILHFLKRKMTTNEVIAEMEKQGYRPARIEELLALGEAHPDLRGDYSIVALGSVWWDHLYDHRNVLCLGCHTEGRSIYLKCLVDVWNEHCRFLGVRKQAL